MKAKSYMDFVDGIASDDVKALRIKDKEYGGSWAKRGGCGAMMMALRKIDRLEEQAKKHSWDIFAAALADQRKEGVLDDLADLSCYLLLIRAEIRRQLSGTALKPAAKRSRTPKAASAKGAKAIASHFNQNAP